MADTFEFDLFTLGCPNSFNFDSPSWSSDFDLGVTFTEISHVYIDWAGEITGGLAIVPWHPSPRPIDVGVYAGLDYPPLRVITFWEGRATYPAPAPFEDFSEIPPSGSAWLDLLDGKNEITIGYEEILMLDGWYTEHGSIFLNRAILVIEGVVPCETVVDITPKTLNTKSNGKWITCKVNLDGCDVNDVNTDSIKLAGIVTPDRVKVTEDGLQIKFNRSIVIDTLILQEGLDRNGGFNIFADVTVTGQLTDGTAFEGTDKIRLMHNTK